MHAYNCGYNHGYQLVDLLLKFTLIGCPDDYDEYQRKWYAEGATEGYKSLSKRVEYGIEIINNA